MKSNDKNLFNCYSRRPAESHWKVSSRTLIAATEQSFALPWGVRVTIVPRTVHVYIPLTSRLIILYIVIKNCKVLLYQYEIVL